MNEATKDRILKALEADHGRAVDSATRARAAFRGMSREQLAAPWGESESTRQEALTRYEQEEAEAFAALKDFAPNWAPRKAFT